jgi:hypothetical protein
VGAAVAAVLAAVSLVWLQGWWAAAWIGGMLERTEPLRNVADGG